MSVAAADAYKVIIASKKGESIPVISSVSLSDGSVMQDVPYVGYNRYQHFSVVPMPGTPNRGIHSRVRIISHPKGEEMDQKGYTIKTNNNTPSVNHAGVVDMNIRLTSLGSSIKTQQVWKLEVSWDQEGEVITATSHFFFIGDRGREKKKLQQQQLASKRKVGEDEEDDAGLTPLAKKNRGSRSPENHDVQELPTQVHNMSSKLDMLSSKLDTLSSDVVTVKNMLTQLLQNRDFSGRQLPLLFEGM